MDAEVYLCRKFDFSYQVFPLDDGAISSGHQNLDPETKGLFASQGLQVLATGSTGEDGKINFKRMVWHHNNAYTYYILAKTNETGMTNFIQDGPLMISQPVEVPSGVGITKKNPGSDPFFVGKPYLQKAAIYMQPQYPLVKGKVIDSYTAPLKNAKVELKETYYRTSNSLQELYNQHTWDPLFTTLGVWARYSTEYTKSWNYVQNTNSAGQFEFRNLAMMYDVANNRVSGPERQLVVSAEGYTAKNIDIPLLKYGEQAVREVKLNYGAVIRGRVTDPENNLAPPAWVALDGGNVVPTDQFGNYEIKCKLLPDKPQKLTVTCNGYIQESIDVYTTKPINHVDVKLYKKQRRIRIKVVDKETWQPIEWIAVSIMKVGEVKNGIPSDLTAYTNDEGIAELIFTNAGESKVSYEVKVYNKIRKEINYAAVTYNIEIPVSKTPVSIHCRMTPAGCLKGKVYAGKDQSSPVLNAAVRLNMSTDTLAAFTGLEGNYYLQNIPVNRFGRVFTAVKSQSNYIGDEKVILINKASNECVTADFNLTVYNDMDITNMMGFPMEVSKLVEENDGKVWINGNLVQIPSNDLFSVNQSTIIPFSKVYIRKSTRVNSANVPLAEPVTLPVKLEKSKIDNVIVMQTFRSEIRQSGNLLLDRYAPNSSTGVIKGLVKIPKTEFNVNLFSLPDIWLATSSLVNTTKMSIPAFVGDKTIKQPVKVGNSGFYACNEAGNAIVYSLPEFKDAAKAKADSSFVQKDKLVLNTTLNSNLSNITPANINLKLGNIAFTKTGMTVPAKQAITFNMEKWKVKSFQWKFTTQGLVLDLSNVQAQMSFPVENMILRYESLYAGQARVVFNEATLMGNVKAEVTGDLKGLIYVEKEPSQFKWKIFASSGTDAPAAHIPGLPGLNAQKLPLSTIQLWSDNSPALFVSAAADLRLFGIMDIRTSEGAYVNIKPNANIPYFYTACTYKPGIPYMHSFDGAMQWLSKKGGLEFDIFLTKIPNFTHNQMLFEWDDNSASISDNLFTVNGFTEEKGKIGPIDIVLMHKNQSTEIDIPAGETIPVAKSTNKYFNNVIGGMEADMANDKWNVFWFEGELTGMNAISNNAQPSRLLFKCNGEIQASGESISVNQLDAFPGMTLRYDMANSRLEGNVNINKDLMGMLTKGTALCLFDQNGWYFNVNGEIAIPGIGGCGLYGLFGDYTAIPPTLSAPYGSMRCIPSEFQGRVSGFLLQGSLTKQLIPPIDWSVTFPIIDLKMGVEITADLSLYARTWMSFGSNVNSYGIATLAEGNISGGLEGGIYKLSTSVNAQLGVAGAYYSNGTYSLIGCGSVKAGVTASVIDPTSVPPSWVGVDITSPDLGIKMNITNNGVNCELILGSCGDNICPAPAL